MREVNVHVRTGHVDTAPLRPFDHEQPTTAVEIGEIEILRLVGIAQPITIHVYEHAVRRVILMDQGVGGAPRLLPRYKS